MKHKQHLTKIISNFKGLYKTEDGRILISEISGVDVGQDGYLGDPETGEIFEVLRNPETEEVEGIYEYYPS